jgi:osmotically-inducible protein OsmY
MNHLMIVASVDKGERVQGIIAPRRSDKPTGEALYDDVTKAALGRFRSCRNFELQRLLCEFRAGILTIRGHVSSYYLKQLAQETVRSLEGVMRIVNRLEVVYVQTNHREIEVQFKNPMGG